LGGIGGSNLSLPQLGNEAYGQCDYEQCATHD
jgi:hypothetical protein